MDGRRRVGAAYASWTEGGSMGYFFAGHMHRGMEPAGDIPCRSRKGARVPQNGRAEMDTTAYLRNAEIGGVSHT